MESQEKKFQDKYCYPESNVLKNKLNIKESSELEKAERDISSARNMMLQKNAMKGNFDLKHYQKIHQYIFGDIYEWAGKIREVDIAKGNLFCRVPFLDGMANDIFGKLQRENFLIGCPKEQYAEKLAYYFGEINALHPFREGNGRSQREFMRTLASVSGYELSYRGINKDKLMEAMIDTFDMKYDKLTKILNENLVSISYEKQFEHMKRIAPKSGALEKACEKYNNYIGEIKKDIEKHGFKATNQAIRNMECIHQKSKSQMTIEEVCDVVKGRTKIDDPELMERCNNAGKLFAQQETLKLEQIEILQR